MKKISTYLVLLIVFCGSITAQNLEGIVLDAETREPVHNALVYLDGTSFLTTTNTEGKFKLSVGNRINTRLVISHVSFERIMISEPFDELPEVFYLEKQITQLDEITVSAVSKSRYTRNQMLKAFRRQFLGNTKGGKACKILNEDDIRLKYDTTDKILYASSNVPLRIENKRLGYKLFWEIIEFKILYKKDLRENYPIISNTGTVIFEDLAPDDRRIIMNRREAYENSPRQFFKLIVEEKLHAHDYLLYKNDIQYPADNLFTVKDNLSGNTVKTVILKRDTEDKGEITVDIRKFSKIGKTFSMKVASQIIFYNDTLSVDIFGYEVKPTGSVLITGEMGMYRTGDILPLNYEMDKFVEQKSELSTEEKIYAQLKEFPQEKIHLHTDKSVYISGEKIWYRAFPVDALLHIPSYISRYIYVELISPTGELVSRDKIRPDGDKLFHNSITMEKDLAEGTYLIRAYTNFMRNRPDYFFEKKIFIADPQISKIPLVPKFTSAGQKGRTSISFYNSEGKNPEVKNLNIKAGMGILGSINTGKSFSFDISPEKQQFIYAEFESEGQKHKRYIPVPQAINDFDVSFFPEGGYLIPDKVCKTGFKALKTNGLSEDITGIIINDKGDTIVNIRSEHAGMGSFSFLPEQGVKYYAVCSSVSGSEKRFQLPVSNPEACALKVFAHKNNIYITVLKGEDFKERRLNLVVHTRGAVVYVGELPEQNTLMIEKELIPSGVSQVLLLDDEMNPLSERAVFYLDEKELAKVNLSTDKPEYSTREHVSTQVQITDQSDNLLAGTFSVSVTDDGDIKQDSLSSIVSELLLCSDMRGYIESPEYYIQNPGSADILMLTQVWKRYDIPAVLKDSLEKPVYLPETSQKISGKVKRIIGSKANTYNTISLVVPDYEYTDETMTDENGRFIFNSFEFPDSTVYIVQAKSKQGHDYVELIPDEEIFPETGNFSIPEIKFENSLEKYVAKSDMKYLEEYGPRAILLDSVLITASHPKPASKYSSILSTVIYPEDYTHIKGLDLSRSLKLFPRLQVYNGKTYSMEHDDDGNLLPPVLIVDDWVLYESELRDIADLDIKDIESIEFIDPTQDKLSLKKVPFPAPGGLLIIMTKSKTFRQGRKIKFNIKTIMPKGYRKAAEFYSPKYETDEDLKKGLDRRTTVFWKPNVIFTNGEAQFDFYTADYKTTYSVVIEGITNDGKIIRKTDKIYLLTF